MEFQFEIKNLLPGRITIIESQDSNSILKVFGLKFPDNCCEGNDWMCNFTSSNWDPTLRKKRENLEYVIDQIGLASSKAQDLRLPITTFTKFLNSNQKLYVVRDMEEPFSVIGILKIGQKRLFICNEMNAQHEVDAMCVLDFYIHESRQRCGYGHELFEAMLQNENLDPVKLAIDRPSFKFLSFLNKHYDLKDPKPQPNNFVVYEGFLNRSGSQAKNLENSNVEKSLNCLQSVPVSSSNQRNCSCVGRCYHMNEAQSTLDNYFKKKKKFPDDSFKRTSSPYSNEGEQNWGVYDAMHSYSENANNSKPCPSGCSLTPVDNTNADKKWIQLQSSWNVLGVKPLDYSSAEKKY